MIWLQNLRKVRYRTFQLRPAPRGVFRTEGRPGVDLLFPPRSLVDYGFRQSFSSWAAPCKAQTAKAVFRTSAMGPSSAQGASRLQEGVLGGGTGGSSPGIDWNQTSPLSAVLLPPVPKSDNLWYYLFLWICSSIVLQCTTVIIPRKFNDPQILENCSVSICGISFSGF